MPPRPKALLAMRAEHLAMLFPPPLLRRLSALADLDVTLVAERFDDPRLAGVLPGVEVLITGWGCPPLDGAVLAAAPALRAVLHTAGSVKGMVTPACWERGMLVSSAADANAVPVAEYTVGAILLAGKGVFALRERYRSERSFVLAAIQPSVGNFGRRVGVVGASRIGRRVLALLAPYDFDVCLYDPYTRVEGVRQVGLEELLSTSDIVTLHAPGTEETHHLLDRDRLALMPDGAVLVNTARGSLVDTEALAGELASGRLSAILDVTDPEPLPPGSPLFDLPNAFLTPHVAGSHGNELARMGASVLDELDRLIAGTPLAHRVTHDDLERAA
ncbi:hydroxyacid dehydrogenase [Nonomuraea muscovyensis]|uniref:Phosphoglycerate dehydrogenase-like enzyme n=1 Tax=Nonomuraea muscovyensis TaxID=1124761 RepID=A0A7X0F2L7_9ACTN|nr:hydroxyacid dehydrogenase [Nonomuraea muscovyensis]MBB6351424.1 phosphoglycerate dehydrogenase-like enzyme [Nonomuraea muscovyensis]MDF2708039.1 hydroxyacid dehydrogenase [Nonomuraea muscovyensis]